MSDYIDKYIADKTAEYVIEEAKKAAKKDPPGFIKKIARYLTAPKSEYALNSFSDVWNKDKLRLLDLGNDVQLLYDKATGNKTGETDRAERNILHAMGEPYKPREAIFNILTNAAPIVASALAGMAIQAVPAGLRVTKNLAKELPENFLPKYVYKEGGARALLGIKPPKDTANYIDIMRKQGFIADGDKLNKFGNTIDKARDKIFNKILREHGNVPITESKLDEWLRNRPKYTYKAAGYYTPILDKKPTKHAADNIDYFTKTGWINKNSKLDKDGFPIVGLNTKILGDLYVLGQTTKSAAEVGAKKGALLIDAPLSALYSMSRSNNSESKPELKPSSEFSSKPKSESKKGSGMASLLKGIVLSVANADIEDPARFNQADVEQAYYTIFGKDKAEEARKNGISPREMVSEIRTYNREHPDRMAEARAKFIKNKATYNAKKEEQ